MVKHTVEGLNNSSTVKCSQNEDVLTAILVTIVWAAYGVGITAHWNK